MRQNRFHPSCNFIFFFCFIELLLHDTNAFQPSSAISKSWRPNYRERAICRPILREKEDNKDRYGEEDDSIGIDSGKNDKPLQHEDDTQSLIEKQQKQIDTLLQLVQRSNNSYLEEATTGEPSAGKSPELVKPSVAPQAQNVYTTTVAPQKAMLFIDGTWLYYSIYERAGDRDLITAKLGELWQHKYYFDWKRLPSVIRQALEGEDHGWSMGQGMHIEIVRAKVFTSYKSDTPKTSYRYQMYQDMEAAKYDMNVKETVGDTEKCVDIQLAVDMLHYATEQNPYDIALLLTGDKDFLPAIQRTRDKGRRFGLVSMRSGCNQALLEGKNNDFNVVWIEDHLDQLIQPRGDTGGLHVRKTFISSFTLIKVIHDYIAVSGLTQVGSRDVGRYLKEVKIGGNSLLEVMKQSFGSLYQVVSGSNIFFITRDDNFGSQDHNFKVGLNAKAEDILREEANRTQFNQVEKDFFENYSLARLENKQTWYWYTLNFSEGAQDSQKPHFLQTMNQPDVNGKEEIGQVNLPEHLTYDYTKCTLSELKNRCRERGLPVSGRKAEVLERVQNDAKEEIERLAATPSPPRSSASRGTPQEYLEELILEYLHANGGRASSRDVGRFLAASKPSLASRNEKATALIELKKEFGSLRTFTIKSNVLDMVVTTDASTPHEFLIFKALRVE